jgi:hypothetical protein
MAYMNQTKKATIASKVKPILAKYGMKGSLSVRNHSTIVLKLTAGPIDFIAEALRAEHQPLLVSGALHWHGSRLPF